MFVRKWSLVIPEAAGPEARRAGDREFGGSSSPNPIDVEPAAEIAQPAETPSPSREEVLGSCGLVGSPIAVNWVPLGGPMDDGEEERFSSIDVPAFFSWTVSSAQFSFMRSRRAIQSSACSVLGMPSHRFSMLARVGLEMAVETEAFWTMARRAEGVAARVARSSEVRIILAAGRGES